MEKLKIWGGRCSFVNHRQLTRSQVRDVSVKSKIRITGQRERGGGGRGEAVVRVSQWLAARFNAPGNQHQEGQQYPREYLCLCSGQWHPLLLLLMSVSEGKRVCVCVRVVKNKVHLTKHLIRYICKISLWFLKEKQNMLCFYQAKCCKNNKSTE